MTTRKHVVRAETGGNHFPKAYSNGLFIGCNGFNFDLTNENPLGSFIEWGYQVENDAGVGAACQPRGNAIGMLTLRYKDMNHPENSQRSLKSNEFVKAFPTVVLGTMFGRSESSGVGCGIVSVKQSTQFSGELRRANMVPDSNSAEYKRQEPLHDMEEVKELTGLPCKLDEMPEIVIDYDCIATGNGAENLFIDMYLHDVSSPARIPGGWPGPGFGVTTVPGSTVINSPATDLLNTVNGINYNLTKDWNINIWLRPPGEDNLPGRTDRGWSGGALVGRFTIDGKAHDFYYKIEQGGANNFDYIGLVMVDRPLHEDKGKVNIHRYIEWARQELPGIINSNPVAGEKYRGTLDNPRGKTPPRMPDGRHVLGGVHFGNEIWWSNRDGSVASIEYRRLKFTVRRMGNERAFGWPVDRKPTQEIILSVGDEQVFDPDAGINQSAIVSHSSDAIVSVTKVGNGFRIIALAAGSARIDYVRADGTQGSFTITVRMSIGTIEIPLGDTLEIPLLRISSSSSDIANVTAESNSNVSRVMSNTPFRIRGDIVGSNSIDFTQVDGTSGTFVVSVINGTQIIPTIGIALGNERVLMPVDIGASPSSHILDILGESNHTVCQILARTPLRIRGDVIGLNTIRYKLEDGNIGSFVVEVT